MTRSRGGKLIQFDPEIERTFHQRNTCERGDTTKNSDTEDHLPIIQTTMDHVGAVERPMMEYSVPTAYEIISSIALPTVQANTFEIKSSIIQIIWSIVQFSGLPEDDPNKHLSNFLKICDTFKFNGVSDDAVRLRIFPFSLCATGRTIMKKLPSEAFNIIDEIATNLYSYGLERTSRRLTGVHSVDAMTAFLLKWLHRCKKWIILGLLY
ncbi:UNVERIFIED_CONTAM: hypothetical protein Sradi_7146500 [Sesamum radiatum]|uniref:Uncharacterized protein n=1 Tax=Sesamum radiatum TaxID=300843 RepID=A0AAW2IWD2_SESRA